MIKKLEFNYNPSPIKVGYLEKLMSHFKHIKFGSSRIAILDYICFNGGQIRATNIEITILLKCAFFTGDGCINAKVILDTIKKCHKDDMLFIRFSDNKAEIYVNDNLFITSSVEPVADFPALCPYIFDNQFHIDSANYDFTPFASSIGKDESRLAMMHIKYGKGKICTTNASVLKWGNIEYNGENLLLPSLYSKLSGHFDFYLSKYEIETEVLVDIPVDREYEEGEETEFTQELRQKKVVGNYLICDYNNECVIITREVMSEYPDFEAVIPSDNPNMIEVETTMLIDAIKKVSIVSDFTNLVIFTIDKMKLKVSCFNSDTLDFANVDVPLFQNNQLEQKQIGLNHKNLLASIEKRKTTKITFSTESRAVIFNDNLLIMPLLIHEPSRVAIKVSDKNLALPNN